MVSLTHRHHHHLHAHGGCVSGGTDL